MYLYYAPLVVLHIGSWCVLTQSDNFVLLGCFTREHPLKLLLIVDSYLVVPLHHRAALLAEDVVLLFYPQNHKLLLVIFGRAHITVRDFRRHVGRGRILQKNVSDAEEKKATYRFHPKLEMSVTRVVRG
jgi:hypothetical protein